jgi:DNA/RNA-binding domain of Phe-tRNA-synthetase-like protein
MFKVTPAWKAAFPNAHLPWVLVPGCAGVLVMRDAQPASLESLTRRKQEIEAQLRKDFADKLFTNDILEIYTQYYKRFKKTYHVKLQVESIALKGKPIPGGPGLVQAMFMAEVKNLLLTAGHDLDTLQLPVTLDVAQGSESYTLLCGETRQLKAGDMFMADSQGVISSIIYGPDQRTMIQPATRSVMYTVYAPQGIPRQAVTDHLNDIASFVQIAAPHSRIDLLQVFP